MSLALKFSLNETDDRTQIVVKDKTGAYNVNTNTGGYGAPNPATSDILTSTITLSLRGSDGTYTPAPIPTASVFPTLPNLIDTPAYLTAFAFGYGPDVHAVFADGIYKAVFTETFLGGSASAEKCFVLKEGICCCYRKAELRIAEAACACDGINSKDRDIALYFRLLKAADCCANPDEVQNYINILTRLCVGCGCGC